jgi:glycosyltransferase involved in cell wall biosynthesis
MKFPASYDITRLGSRMFDSSPNGIHRVDAALARYFLSVRTSPSNGTWFPRLLTHRVVSHEAALEVLDGIDAHFAETHDPKLDSIYDSIKDWVLRDALVPASVPTRVRRRPKIPLTKALSWAVRHGLDLRATAARSLPRGARYFNASHFGLAVPGAFDWLASRPDVKAIFFIHDMLPFETPEYFPTGEFVRHQNRMHNLARHGAGAVVSTEIVKAALQTHLSRLGRLDLPILTAPLPVAPIFREATPLDEELSARSFFIQCGTIEPRKNHLTILQVWRELVARHGRSAPKLLLVGARGWENENVLDLLDRSVSLRDHVLEVSGLPTPVLRRLLGSARALLMPSFAEGFGLPLAEANAAGARVIASDIPVFHEIAGGSFVPLSPIDGIGWLRAIENLSNDSADSRSSARTASSVKSENFFGDIDAFIDRL